MDPVVIIFIVLALGLISGIPVAFCIGMSSMAFLLYQGYPDPMVIVGRMVDGARSYSMMALPMFIFAGALMAYGSTPRLMRLANMLVSRVPGGLGAATLVTCGFFGAVSGSGVASTAAIGGIVGDEMIKQGYGRGITAGILAGGGVMATLIPPSLVMVIYAGTTGVSVGDMFVAGIGPGLFIILLLILMNCLIAKHRGIGAGTRVIYTSADRIKIVLDALLPLFMPIMIIRKVGRYGLKLTNPCPAENKIARKFGLFYWKILSVYCIIYTLNHRHRENYVSVRNPDQNAHCPREAQKWHDVRRTTSIPI